MNSPETEEISTPVVTKSAESKPPCCCGWDHSIAFLILRGWLALRAIVTGIEKYAIVKTVQKPLMDPVTGMEDPSGALVDVKIKMYGLANYHAIPPSLSDKFSHEPLLPKFMMDPFCAMLGPALIISGLMLLAGLGTRLSLFVQGVLYIMLTAGLILIKQDDGVAWLAIHIALIAFALTLARDNKFALLKKW